MNYILENALKIKKDLNLTLNQEASKLFKKQFSSYLRVLVKNINKEYDDKKNKRDIFIEGCFQKIIKIMA